MNDTLSTTSSTTPWRLVVRRCEGDTSSFSAVFRSALREWLHPGCRCLMRSSAILQLSRTPGNWFRMIKNRLGGLLPVDPRSDAWTGTVLSTLQSLDAFVTSYSERHGTRARVLLRLPAVTINPTADCPLHGWQPRPRWYVVTSIWDSQLQFVGMDHDTQE